MGVCPHSTALFRIGPPSCPPFHLYAFGIAQNLARFCQLHNRGLDSSLPLYASTKGVAPTSANGYDSIHSIMMLDGAAPAHHRGLQPILRIAYRGVKTTTGLLIIQHKNCHLLAQPAIIISSSPRVATRCRGCADESLKRTSPYFNVQAFRDGSVRWSRTQLKRRDFGHFAQALDLRL